jgi:hypothetical protein
LKGPALDEAIRRIMRGEVSGSELRLSPDIAPRIETDPAKWVMTLFGPGTTTNLSAGFAEHHMKFWRWLWQIRLGVKCRPFVFLLARGGAKSSSFEMGATAVGALNTRKYILYISETEDQAKEHLATIQSNLETPELRAVYPNLGARLENQYGASKGWSSQKIRTKAGLDLRCLSLEKAARGIKQDGFRPDLPVFDDIDSEEDTLQAKKKKLNQIRKKILAASATSATGLFGQNIITNRSIANDFVKGDPPFFADAEIVGPIPAAYDLEVGENPDYVAGSGQRKWFVLGGTPTWEGQSLEVIEGQINDWSLPAFLAESQHEVYEKAEGAIFPEWDEVYHVVTYSEFCRVHKDAGVVRDEKTGGLLLSPPQRWDRCMSGDRGYTHGHPFVFGWFTTPAEPRHGEPDNTDIFVRYLELQRPVADDPKDVKVDPLAIVREAERLEKLAWRWDDDKGYSIRKRVLSHEAKGERNLFWNELGFDFAIADAGKTTGIADMKAFLTVNFDKPHPYRRYPDDWPDEELRGTPVMGRPRFVVVVPDDQGALLTEWKSRVRYVLKCQDARDNFGQSRFRSEMPLYSWTVTLDGTERQIPAKGNDDAIDQTRMVFGEGWHPDVAKLTGKEKAEKRVFSQHENLTHENIRQIVDDDERTSLLAEQQVLLNRALAEEERRKSANVPTRFRIRRRR